MEKEYYIKMNNEDFGPFTFDKVCSLGIFDTTFVSIPQDNAGWRMAKDIPELRGYTVIPETLTVESPETAHYYLREGTEIRGPYSLEEFALMEVKESDFVGINSTDKWYFAESITGLLPLLERILHSQLNQEQQSTANEIDDLYYVSLDGENFGPFNIERMKGFGLFESTLVRKYNEDFWRRAGTLPELQGYLMSEEPVFEEPEAPVDINNPMLYDMTEDFNKIYEEYRSNIIRILSSNKNLMQAAQENNPTIYTEEMFEMSVLQYNRSFDDILSVLQTVQGKCDQLENKYNEDEQRLNNLYLHKTVVVPSIHQRPDYQEISAIDERRKLVKEKYNKIKSEILFEVREAIELFYHKNPSVFNERYEIAPTTEKCWHEFVKETGDVQKRFYLGESCIVLSPFGEKIQLRRRKYPIFLNGSNLVLHYKEEDKQRCLNIVNTLIGRAMMAVPSGGLNLGMIDSNGMTGTCEEWKRLSRNVFRVSSRSSDIQKMLDETVLHIEHIIQNLLKGQTTLEEYNKGKENQEPYRLLVIEDFPVGIPMEGINNLKKILKNGIRAGVTTILLINENEIQRSDDALKALRTLGLEQYEDHLTYLYQPEEDDEENRIPKMEYDILPDAMLQQVVNAVNKGFEVKNETVLNLADYLPEHQDWWTGTSASMVEIPFGISTTKNISQLRITQESGQNSAVVIGIPGSGKSVFLHSIIVDAAIKYSPDELQMYLLDFSGVEFNTYANHKLPHARVIAPEAEREFGLSVLRELKEEGARRMALCRENDVTSIVEYRKKNPNTVMPRLLVIIDEFQKIFEIENDAISNEANSIIHIIIQEYRKFGINLILATQRIPSSKALPKDLIANRVVFKSAPSDFTALITWQGNKMPNLKTGQCIYNSESGAEYSNEQIQGFFIPMPKIEQLLDELNEKAYASGRENKNLVVFRGNDQPEFKNRRLPRKYMVLQDIPEEVPVLLGQSIAVSDTDVCAELRKESSNNFLVVGGEKDVAQNLMLHAALSTTLVHTDNSSVLYLIFNFMRPSDPQYNKPLEQFEGMPFPVKMVSEMSEVKEVLTEVKNEIDARRQDKLRPLTHIFLNFFAFQLASVFDRGGRTGDAVSDEGKLLDYILRNGPTCGVFTLLQTDKSDSLARIGNKETDLFTHRAVMQMSEVESNKLMESPLANRLFVISRPSSKYRAFYRNPNRNETIKFKPYK